MEESPKIIYSSYTEAQKRATAKYREANKEKVNAQRKKYYESRKEKDPDFLQYKRDKAKEYYLKKKNSKPESNEDEPKEVNVELVTITHEEPEEPLEHEETIEEHWEKKSKARDHSPETLLEASKSEGDLIPEKKQRKPRTPKKSKVDIVSEKELEKPNLDIITLKELLLPEPKTPIRKSRSKKIYSAKDVLHSA
jgi:hypothetical protein